MFGTSLKRLPLPKLTLGAGTYNGKEVDKFTILEQKHAAPVTGQIAWTGAKTEITLKMTIDKQATITFFGPWGNN